MVLAPLIFYVVQNQEFVGSLVSVMQSDGNSFYGDVVFNKTYRETKNMTSEYLGTFSLRILSLRVIEENAY